MNRTAAVTTWREVCGSDMIMTLPPTGRLLEEFARRIEAAEREACAKEVPTNWCDPLLTGPSAMMPSPGRSPTFKDVENLLRQVQARIRAR